MEPLLDSPIVNKVAQSGIEVFDLSQFLPRADVASIDLADFLVERIVLREKVFRETVAAHDWTRYQDRVVAVFCSEDAIIPSWAWMLVVSKLHGVAASVTLGSVADARREHFERALASFDWEAYRDGTVVVKGCGSAGVPESAYARAMSALMGVSKKVMFGEPCSSVPLWRRREGA